MIKIFGDSNVWGDEQPGCSIGKNSKPSKTTFPYYIAKHLNMKVKNYAVSGASLNLIHDTVLFNPVNKNDIVIVYLPTCSKQGFIHIDRNYTQINDVIRYKLRSQIFNKDMGKSTIDWIFDNMWHEKALYYNVIKNAYAIYLLVKHSNVFYFWNTRHYKGGYLNGQDGLSDELKRRNNLHHNYDFPINTNFFDNSIIDFGIDLNSIFSKITIDWNIIKTFDEITNKLNLYKYKQGHHLPIVHKYYAKKIIDILKERLNVY